MKLPPVVRLCSCRHAGEGLDEQVRLDRERWRTDLHLQPGGECEAQEHRGEDRLWEWVLLRRISEEERRVKTHWVLIPSFISLIFKDDIKRLWSSCKCCVSVWSQQQMTRLVCILTCSRSEFRSWWNRLTDDGRVVFEKFEIVKQCVCVIVTLVTSSSVKQNKLSAAVTWWNTAGVSQVET